MAVQMPPLLKDSTGQEIKQAIQGLTPVIPDFISDAFSVERSYSKGDITIYNNNVYEFTANKSAGAWDSTKVTQTTIGAVCTSLNNSLTQLEVNNLGARVDISSYTTLQNLYECPSDGFLCADLTATTNAKCIIRIFGNSGTTNQLSIGGWANSTYGSYSCFVRKGMKAQVATIENSGKAYFIPLQA